MQEAWVRSLCRDDLLEVEMAAHSSALAWEIPRTEELGGLSGLKESDTSERVSTVMMLSIFLYACLQTFFDEVSIQSFRPFLFVVTI